ncbi:chorismate-binding protein [Candidatus Bathyarchaeota archaeon]|nr:chorismate-binding protein [Candidatus Bathyarchaeota archaeon]
MAKCPKCGAEVSTPVKTWTISPKKKKGPTLVIELYSCTCGNKFRVPKKT